MIKRRFYNIEHGDGNSASSSSSDSEDFDPADEGGEQEDNGLRAEEEGEKEVAAEEEKEKEGEKPASGSPCTRSSSSGYESEDSSGNEINCDSTGVFTIGISLPLAATATSTNGNLSSTPVSPPPLSDGGRVLTDRGMLPPPAPSAAASHLAFATEAIIVTTTIASDSNSAPNVSRTNENKTFGFLVNDCDEDSGKDRENLRDNQAHECHPKANKGFVSKSVTRTIDSEDSLKAEMSECVLKCKSVFKCRICPRIVCLSEDTLLAHLKSKRHARSKKLLGEGRLKLMLNSDGEIEEEEETHAERHARTVALIQPKKKNKGRQRQSKRRRMKVHSGCDGSKHNPPQKKQRTKRSKIED